DPASQRRTCRNQRPTTPLGEVGDPPLIGPLGPGPATLDVVDMARRLVIALGGDRGAPTPPDALDPSDPHQPLDLATTAGLAGTHGRLPELAAPIEPPVAPP